MVKKTRLLIVDDDASIREVLRSYLESAIDLEIVAEAPGGREALELVRTRTIDVVLMDINMPDMDGIEAAGRIRRSKDAVRVLMLTVLDDPDRVKAAIANGVSGFVTKDIEPGALVNAVRMVASGLSVLSPTPMQHVAFGNSTPEEVPDLTERERVVLSLLCEGRTNAEICDQLFLSNSTVKSAVSSVMTKLGASSRLHAVARAHELRLTT